LQKPIVTRQPQHFPQTNPILFPGQSLFQHSPNVDAISPDTSGFNESTFAISNKQTELVQQDLNDVKSFKTEFEANEPSQVSLSVRMTPPLKSLLTNTFAC
jgi:hypothetical protein